MTVHDPAEQQLSLFMENGPVGAIESIVGIPSADETVKGFCFFAHGRIRIRRSQHIDHCLSRSFCEPPLSLSARRFLRPDLRTQCDCRSNKRHQDERWRFTSASHGGDVLALLQWPCHWRKQTHKSLACPSNTCQRFPALPEAIRFWDSAVPKLGRSQ